MLIKLFKGRSKFFLLSFFLIITLTPISSKAIDKPPFNIKETVKREMVYPYAFERVWAAALEYLQSLDKEFKEREKILQSNIFIDKDSGLLSYTVTKKARLPFGYIPPLNSEMQWVPFSSKRERRIFTSYNFLIKSIDENKSIVYCHITTYDLYNLPPDLKGALIPDLAAVDPTTTLEKIKEKLEKI